MAYSSQRSFHSTRVMMKLILLLLVLASQAKPTCAQRSPESLFSSQAVRIETVPGGWQHIQIGENTDCALGTPFSFFHRPGLDSSKLLIYFQGGGACWDWVSCSGPFDTSVDRAEIEEYRGIFDFSNPANPFRDYSTLFVPYCTGDVHVGAAAETYGENVNARPVTHQGAHNVDQALQWAKVCLEDPQRVVVAGASAGSYGAIFHAPRIAESYPPPPTSSRLVTPECPFSMGTKRSSRDGERGPFCVVPGRPATTHP